MNYFLHLLVTLFLLGVGVAKLTNTTIIFPNSDFITINTYGHGRQNGSSRSSSSPAPPPHILRALVGTEDIAKSIRELATNVRVETDRETGEQYLVDKETGEEKLDKKGRRVLVGGAKTKIHTIPFSEDNSFSQGNLSMSIANKSRTKVIIGRHGVVTNKPQSTGSNNLLGAECRPEDQVVTVPAQFPPHIIHLPRCVRVQRCGGCCGLEIMACEPTEVTTVEVSVKKFEYLHQLGKFEYLEQEGIPVERHTQCECRCRVKAQDCTPQQVYSASDCLCLCSNLEEQRTCLQNDMKIWDPTHCMCTCREIRDCSSGFFFNLNTCACQQSPRRQGRRKRGGHTHSL